MFLAIQDCQTEIDIFDFVEIGLKLSLRAVMKSKETKCQPVDMFGLLVSRDYGKQKEFLSTLEQETFTPQKYW